MISWITRRMRHGDDSGVAMIMVIGMGVVLMAIAFTMLNLGTFSLGQSAHDQRYFSAITAADAGVDDYLARLNNDPSYYKYTSVAKTCTGASGTVNLDPNNPAMKGYTPIPGPPSNAQFTYQVDSSTFCSSGYITVTSTGKVNGQTRTEVATIKRRSFLDYLYFTDIEDLDPSAYTTNPWASAKPPSDPATMCGRHYYDIVNGSGRPDDVDGNNPGCSTINFGGGDVINGPLHTNDAMLVCGSVTFNGPTTTSWAGNGKQHWRSNPGCSGNSPNFAANKSGCPNNGAGGNDACFASKLNPPPDNTKLKSETDPNLASPAGCLFTGPTRIVLKSNGTMDVTSPDTPRTGANPGCALGSNLTSPTNLSIPADGVVYVQNVPSGSPYQQCTKPQGVLSPQNPVGYPVAGDATTYGCTDGDVFVSGTLSGQLTIGAEHNIDVVDDVTYANGTSGNDLLGLIANNYVEVYHPVTSTSLDRYGNCTGSNLSNATQNLQLYAAVLAVTHSFRVQNYNCGSQLGTLKVVGAIAQKYRGIVGIIGTSGFVKNYTYDTRLKYASPPKFLDPVQTSFTVANYAEQ